eukprot:5842516-Karenia_brevis.AAC.1
MFSRRIASAPDVESRRGMLTIYGRSFAWNSQAFSPCQSSGMHSWPPYSTQICNRNKNSFNIRATDNQKASQIKFTKV